MQFSEIPELLRINGEALAKATAEYEFMEDMLKTELALCAPMEGSEASKEREARKHPNYRKAAEGGQIQYAEAQNGKRSTTGSIGLFQINELKCTSGTIKLLIK